MDLTALPLVKKAFYQLQIKACRIKRRHLTEPRHFHFDIFNSATSLIINGKGNLIKVVAES